MPRKPATYAANSASSTRTVHVAIQGCCHGELNKIYDECKRHEENWGKKIDLLLCCGDFQSIRNEDDLNSMAVPPKYRAMGDFHEYCASGEDAKTAPYLTIFIGGNHEASNVLFQNYYGGYVAPNIYYLGHSGVIDIKGLRVGGLSGIWKPQDRYTSYPRPPYTERTVRSAYHVRQFEVDKLSLFGSLCKQQQESSISADHRPIDIMLSHDWPAGITKYGDEAQLLRYKHYFEEDIKNGTLGNPLTMELLGALRPRYWCSAHLHCFFTASVAHTDTSRTQFIALDKCTKEKSFLDFIDIAVPTDLYTETISIPALWQEVIRLTQPALERSNAASELRFEMVKSSDVPLASPPLLPLTVGPNTNVGMCLLAQKANPIVAKKRAREVAEQGMEPTADWLIEDV